MKLNYRQYPIILLTCMLVTTALDTANAQKIDNTEVFDSKIKAGYEVGMILEKTQSADGKIAIIYTARKKGMTPSKWPLLMKDFHYIGSIAEEVTKSEAENWIVSLPDKRRIGIISGGKYELSAFHPDDHRSDLTATWSPPAGDGRIGLVGYSSDADSSDVILVGFDGDSMKTASLLKILNEATDKFMAQQKSFRKDKTYQHLYSFSRSGIKNSSLPIGSSMIYSIDFKGIVDMDQGDKTSPIDAMVSLRITNGKDGVLNAKIEGVNAPGKAPAVSKSPSIDPAPATIEEFTAFRKKMSDLSNGDTWKTVSKELPKDAKGQRHYIMAWVQNSSIEMMMRYKADNDEDNITNLYYYHKGSLVSVIEVRKGAYTEISEVGEVSEIYNFVGEKLFSWLNSSALGSEYAKSTSPGFSEKGKEIRGLSRDYAAQLAKSIKVK